MFKKPKKNFRPKQESSGSDSDEEIESTIGNSNAVQDARTLRNMRKRVRGVNVEELNTGKELPKEKKKKEGYNVETGGYVDLKTLKREIREAEDVEQIGTTFAAETNRRDEDTEMLKYVEEQLKKRKGGQDEDDEVREKARNPEDMLYELPDHLKGLSGEKKKSEGMLSNQMLSGIPEVDLGIEAKIKNIEATEEAKQKILADRLKEKEKISEFVPTNMATNFVQHNRFKVDNPAPVLVKPAPEPAPAPLRVGDAERPHSNKGKGGRGPGEKATDDFHYEKFKKQLRR